MILIALLDASSIIASIPTWGPLCVNTRKRLLMLDQPTGLPEAACARLLVKCTCGLIMTHRAFEEHTCAPIVIDLTSSDGSD